jgi:hypothetical protein
MNHPTYTDPDQEREIAHENDHDARHGLRGPDPVKAAAAQHRVAARYADAMTLVTMIR